VPTVIFFLVSLIGILSRRLRFFLGCLVGVFCKKNVDPELKGDGILALVAVAAEEGVNSTQGPFARDKNL
jgi:hypothetical protein